MPHKGVVGAGPPKGCCATRKVGGGPGRAGGHLRCCSRSESAIPAACVMKDTELEKL